MKKGLGVIGLVAGVLLIVWGYKLSPSVNGQFTRIFTGSPGDKSMGVYVVGSAMAAFDVFQIYFGKKIAALIPLKPVPIPSSLVAYRP